MKQTFFVGTYTEPIRFGTGELYQGQGRGIYTCALDADGALSLTHCSAGIKNPSYLCLSADNRTLYCVNELKDDTGKTGGHASAFRVGEDYALSFINRVPVDGADPCHIALAPEEDALYVSNFMSGSVTVLERLEDHSLSPVRQLIQHQGSSVIAARQSSPHAHSLTFDPSGRLAFVPDLGADKVFIYQRQDSGPCLMPAPIPFLSTFGGSGPRHLTFNKKGDHCYLINELASSISVFAADGANLRLLQTISTLPQGFTGDNICADVHLSGDESLLFGSNRGHDSIVTFTVEPNGMLTYAACMPSGGRTPRSFTVDPSNRFLVIGNQTTNNICCYAIDFGAYRHRLVSTLEIGSPVCVKFLR